MMEPVFLLICLSATYAVKHSLSYFITASSGLQTFPEFVAVLKVNGAQLGYYDSSNKTVEFKQDWVQKLNEDDPEHLDWYTQACVTGLHVLKAQIECIQQHFNHTGGVHTFQEMTGCEWDDETGEVEGFELYGYDGEDFISLDLKTETWLFTEQSATFKWDTTKVRFEFSKVFITKYCPHWLKKYLIYGKSSLQRKDPPSVSLLQKTPSSPVSCHATGFYPDRATMFWRKDGEELHEDVDHGEILLNHDGTFQMNVHLNVSSVEPENWRKYQCVFNLSLAEDIIITKLDKKSIHYNGAPPSDFPAAAVIGVVGLLLLTVCIIGLCIWRKKKNGFRHANSSDSPGRNPNHKLPVESRNFLNKS